MPKIRDTILPLNGRGVVKSPVISTFEQLTPGSSKRDLGAMNALFEPVNKAQAKRSTNGMNENSRVLDPAYALDPMSAVKPVKELEDPTPPMQKRKLN